MKATPFVFDTYAVNLQAHPLQIAFCVISLVHYFEHISSDPLKDPNLMVKGVTNSAVEYQTQTNDDRIDAVITGSKVLRFGIPMIGEYVNTGRGRRVKISPAVPGAQYRITAWALGDGSRSATPAVVDATIRERSTMKYKCIELKLCIFMLALAIIVLAGSIGIASRTTYMSTYLVMYFKDFDGMHMV